MIGKTGKALGEAAEAASLYTRAEADHFKLRLAKAITVWSSNIIAIFVFMLCAVLILIFAGLAGAMYLQRFMSPEAAYLSICGIYALTGLLIAAFRKTLIEPLILKSTLKELFDEP